MNFVSRANCHSVCIPYIDQHVSGVPISTGCWFLLYWQTNELTIQLATGCNLAPLMQTSLDADICRQRTIIFVESRWHDELTLLPRRRAIVHLSSHLQMYQYTIFEISIKRIVTYWVCHKQSVWIVMELLSVNLLLWQHCLSQWALLLPLLSY